MELIWITIGIAGFWFARWAWQLDHGRQPVTIGTLTGMAMVALAGPLNILFGVVFLVMWLSEGDGLDNPVKRFLRRPVRLWRS